MKAIKVLLLAPALLLLLPTFSLADEAQPQASESACICTKAIDWDEVEKIMDTAIEEAVKRTDKKFGIGR